MRLTYTNTNDDRFRPPENVKFKVIACFYPPTTIAPTTFMTTTAALFESTTELTSTQLLTSTTTTLPPTTAAMNYCAEGRGMNEPLNIRPDQVVTSSSVSPADINPTSSTPGLNFTTMNPKVNVTLDQPATITLLFIPTNIRELPTNVEEFEVLFLYPNGTLSTSYISTIGTVPSTTTVSSGQPLETTTATSSSSPSYTPSPSSPRVELPVNFQVPPGTIIIITIVQTNNQQNPVNVRI